LRTYAGTAPNGTTIFPQFTSRGKRIVQPALARVCLPKCGRVDPQAWIFSFNYTYGARVGDDSEAISTVGGTGLWVSGSSASTAWE